MAQTGAGDRAGTSRDKRRSNTSAGAQDERKALDQVGPRLRAARLRRGLSLREIARRIEVSPSFVSQVETGKASPSVGTLYALVNELGLSLDEAMSGNITADGVDEVNPDARADVAPDHVTDQQRNTLKFDSDAPWMQSPSMVLPGIEVPLQAAEGRPTIKFTGVTWERLTPEDDPFVDFLYVTYAPGGSSCIDETLMRHGGREYGHIISGQLDVQIGFDHYQMGPGDSIHFDSMTPHRLDNRYDEPCVALWVVVARKGDPRATLPNVSRSGFGTTSL